MCDGQLLTIDRFPELFQLIGTWYGGDGENNFMLPDLRGRCVISQASYSLAVRERITLSRDPTGNFVPGSLGLNFIIALEGLFPSEHQNDNDNIDALIGEGRLFAFNFEPWGWVECKGQVLVLDHHASLFSFLGTTFGGNYMTTFALPDLREAVATMTGHLGYGETLGLSQSESSGLAMEFLELKSCIALKGRPPSPSDTWGGAPPPYLAEIRAFYAYSLPPGWALCEGQLLSIDEHDALFSLLGTTYGGDGKTTFALPDLRERFPVHPQRGATNRFQIELGGFTDGFTSDMKLVNTDANVGIGYVFNNYLSIPGNTIRFLAVNYIIALEGTFPLPPQFGCPTFPAPADHSDRNN